MCKARVLLSSLGKDVEQRKPGKGLIKGGKGTPSLFLVREDACGHLLIKHIQSRACHGSQCAVGQPESCSVKWAAWVCVGGRGGGGGETDNKQENK